MAILPKKKKKTEGSRKNGRQVLGKDEEEGERYLKMIRGNLLELRDGDRIKIREYGVFFLSIERAKTSVLLLFYLFLNVL